MKAHGLTRAEVARVPSDVLAMAERVIPVSLEAARALPNLLGRLVPGVLAHNAFYTCRVDDVRTLYVRREVAR